MRNFLVEVFAVVKVNLLLFKGKIAGMRATLRSRFVDLLGLFVSAHSYIWKVSEELCPSQKQFHVVYEQVGSFKRPHKTIIAPDEQDALDQFIKTLPETWRGGVSVFDDSVGHEDEMPLLHVTI
jgi:hypothetical protein